MTSALDEASTLVEKRESQIEQQKNQISRLRSDLQDAKGASNADEKAALASVKSHLSALLRCMAQF